MLHKSLPVWFVELNMYDVAMETMFVSVGFNLALKCALFCRHLGYSAVNNIHWVNCNDSFYF